MASPYSHPGPGPGPSYYTQPQPPPHHIYPNPSPGPGPNANPYSYPYPPPPHLTSHRPGMHHQSPARATGRGGNSYSSRVQYQNFQQPYSHVNLSLHSPHPQHPAPHNHNPYAPNQKYNPPYTPPYPYPPPSANPTYSPSWHAQQPLSPLPKQLSMPPPQEIAPAYYEPPPQESAQEQAMQLSDPIAVPTSESEHKDPASSSPSPPNTPAPVPTSSTASTSQPSSYSQMGTISTELETQPVSATEADTSTSQIKSPTRHAVPNPIATFAIWSRRPQDPSHAPSIIISPRARPPPDVIQLAIDLKTPPATPIASPLMPLKALKALPSSKRTDSISEKDYDTASTPPLSAEDVPSIPDNEYPPALASSQTNSSVPSSSVTETTDTPTLPGSPVSTSDTSISIAGTSPKVASSTPASPAHPAPARSPTPITDTLDSQPLPATTKPLAPTPSPAPPVKKSWASLLRPAPSDTPSSSSTSATRNSLPTSSVVGFSIPASSPVPAAPAPVSPTKKSELIGILTGAPNTGPNVSQGGLHHSGIRPRGLVNSGNMCFANSVLQVLLYCPPFHRLFAELGRLLGSSSTTLGLFPSIGKEKNVVPTPLVDATIEFLKEFITEKKDNQKAGDKEKDNKEWVKGKQKEANPEDDEWNAESFLPSYVYDAMKEKKRFDNMRGGHQEDAEEFFGFYLDTLEEELLSILHSIQPLKQGKHALVEEREEPAPPEDDGWLEVGKRNRMVVTRTIKATESPITRIFGGKFRSTLRAPSQKDSVIVEDWRSLRLDIQREQINTIQDALSFISHPQSVQVTHPSRPGVTIDATQQVLIEALPPILVLHMKRFCYDTAVGGVVKVGKQVRFGPELEIGPDAMASGARRGHPTRYKLFGALYHHGHSASGGHYTLDVLHPNRYPGTNSAAKQKEGWVRIDDELVSDVRPEDVFGLSERDDMRCAYLLFYKRIQ